MKATIRRVCGGDIEALRLLGEALERGRGGNNNPNGANQHSGEVEVNGCNATIDLPEAKPRNRNDVSHAIRRLTKQRPDLLEKVEAGELSPNRALCRASPGASHP